MKNQNEKPSDIRFNGKKLWVHMIAWCLLMTQMASVPQAMAQEGLTFGGNSEVPAAADNTGVNIVPTSDVGLPDSTVNEANAQRDANRAHEAASIANGGTLSNCRMENEFGNFNAYDDANNAYNTFTRANTQAIRDRINDLNQQGSELLNQQQQYAVAHGDFTDPASPIDQRYEDIKQRYEEAQANLNRIQREIPMAEAELNAARAACSDDSWCTPQERERINVAQTRLNQLNAQLNPAMREYRAARNAYRNSPKDVKNNAPGAMADTAANSNAMAGSHAVSGCGSNFDITTNTDTDCALSGPLFEADRELTRIATAGINEAKQMAEARADALFNLELEKLYADDYKMYEMAVTGGLPEGTNLDNVDGMADSNPRKTRNLKFTISNIKTMALASSSVKDVVCEPHDLSVDDGKVIDSKATYVFKAAAATWLMAVANDTRYYSQESSCRTDEMLGGDQNNMQLITVERAANVLDQQLENLCLRVGGQVDKDGDGTLDGSYLDPPGPGYDWRDYGETPEQAEAHVKVLRGYVDGDITHPPLKERCEEYLVNLRGEEFRDKPRTREVALQMMRDAEALALEELMGKMEKIKIADANVKKGEKWVADVQKKIVMMLILKAVLTAAFSNASGICGGCGPWCGFCCSMCPVAMTLKQQLYFVAEIVLAIWLFSELMRARAFLAKWKEKLYHAKHFSHLACNFETAKAEEDTMSRLGEEAKQRKAEEVERARQEAIRGIYDETNQIVGDTLAQRTTYTPTQIKEFNKGLMGLNNEALAIAYLSDKILGRQVKSWQELNNALASQGLELVLSFAMDSANANEVTRDLTTGDAPESAATATHLVKRNVRSNTNSLNIAEGTESFRYFLVQRNLNFQYQTSDITNQPDHTRSDTRIANRGQPKNSKNRVLRSIDQLAQYHLDGNLIGGVVNGITVVNSVADLDEEDQNGFPTPETRYMTIQKARRLFEENLELLHGGIAELTFQRDAVVQLLTQMRKRMGTDKTGLGETQLIPNAAPAPVCMVGDVANLDFDPTCGCSTEGSCTSFEYPSFNATTPNALKAGGRLSMDTANSLASGNLKSAALNGGKLVSNAAAVRKDLLEKQKKLGLNNGSSSSSSSNSANSSGGDGSGSDFMSDNERRASENLAKLGVGSDSNSAFGRVRRSLLNSSGSSDSDKDKNKNAVASANSSSKSKSSRRRGGSGAGANGKGGGKTLNENFSLTDGGANLDLEGLTDEERARLGLTGANGAGKKGQGDQEERYAHVRNLTQNSASGSGVGKDHPDYGINTNRKNSLFKIISKRYEKTAFPQLLDQ